MRKDAVDMAQEVGKEGIPERFVVEFL